MEILQNISFKKTMDRKKENPNNHKYEKNYESVQ